MVAGHSHKPEIALQTDRAYILSLPSELLAHIFMLVRDETIATSAQVYRWIIVSHVCRHFREVALASAKLWDLLMLPESQRNPMFFERMEAMVARSHQVPLFVKLNDDTPELHALVKGQLHRIYNLSLRLSKPSRLGSTPAPQLRCLSIHAHTEDSDITWSDMFGSVGTPKLEETNRKPRPLPEVVGLLREIKSLEKLHLEGMLPPAPHSEHLPALEEPAVLLRRLTHLTIVGSASRCARFLSNIVTPSITHFKIRCVATSQFGIPPLADMACARLNDGLSTCSPDPFLSFALDESTRPTETCFIAWSSSEYTKGLPLADPEPSRIFAISVTHDHWGEQLPAFIARLPLYSAERIFVAVGTYFDSQFANNDFEAWSTISQNLPLVRELHIVSKSDIPFRKPGAREPEPSPYFHVPNMDEWDGAAPGRYDQWFPHEDEYWMLHDEFTTRMGKTHLGRQDEMRREMEEIRRCHAHSMRRQAELEESRKKLRAMFPTMKVCVMNGWCPGVDGRQSVISIPFIPSWDLNCPNWPFIPDAE
ncbi:hypothetical protein EIP86_006114 [Pleurotus ostreatoroseus]|nr:hypothetical protein EIP86_006114 [Pleurotus ostreatoroseus]